MSNSNDFFLIKLDTDGNVLWAKSSQGQETEIGISVNTDSNNNVYAVGKFNYYLKILESQQIKSH